MKWNLLSCSFSNAWVAAGDHAWCNPLRLSVAVHGFESLRCIRSLLEPARPARSDHDPYHISDPLSVVTAVALAEAPSQAMSLTHCHGFGLKRWPVCQQGHVQLSSAPKSRSQLQLRRKPLLKFYQRPARGPPACGVLTSSVLTGRSYALDLESGRLYKTEIMNRSVRPHALPGLPLLHNLPVHCTTCQLISC